MKFFDTLFGKKPIPIKKKKNSGTGKKVKSQSTDKEYSVVITNNELKSQLTIPRVRDVDAFCPFDEQDACTIVARHKENVKMFQRITGAGTWKFNIVTQEIDWSPETFAIFNRDPAFPVTVNTFLTYVHPDDRPELKARWKESFEKKQMFDMTHRVLVGDAKNILKWVRTCVDMSSEHSFQRDYVIGIIQDITDKRLAEESLKRTSIFFLASEEGSVITDENGIIQEINKSFTRVTGYSAEEVVGKHVRILKSGLQNKEFYESMWKKIASVGSWQGEIWNKKKSGEIFIEYLKIFAVGDANGKITNYVSLFSDISEHKKQSEKVQFAAQHDLLTKLPNRTKFLSFVEKALREYGEDIYTVVLMLDIDDFKNVNHYYEHVTGDLILQEMASRISSTIRGHDVCARLGGDEFAVMLTNLTSIDDVNKACIRLNSVLLKPFSVNGFDLDIKISIGCAVYPPDKCSSDELLRHASEALFYAKRNGKNQIHFFNPAESKKQEDDNEMRQNLAAAISHNNIELYWQPYFDLSTRKIVGAEALMRWNIDGRILLPGEFIHVLDAPELAVKMGQYIMANAFNQLNELNKKNYKVNVSINLFEQHLFHHSLESEIDGLLAKYPSVDPTQITFEILESVAILDFEYINALINKMFQKGIKFAIDDFGTGFSSLSYFSKLHAQYIKIDRAFVSKLTDTELDKSMVQNIINIAETFNKNIIAEGIEKEAQVEILKDMGVTTGQGYLFSKPVSFELFENMLSLDNSWQISYK